MIAFNASNGFCPFFLYNATRYFIQDKKDDGKWFYTLYSKDLTEELVVFESTDQTSKFVQSDPKIYCVNRLLGMYESDTKDYFINNNNQIKIRFKSVQLSDSFDRYSDCLEWSKQYVENVIKSEDKQIRLEGLR